MIIAATTAAVHFQLSISLGDQLPDWNVTARYRGHCTWSMTVTAIVVVVMLLLLGVRYRSVIELLRPPRLFCPGFT